MTIALIILACLAGSFVACALCAMNQLTHDEDIKNAKQRRRVRAGTCFTEDAR